MNCTGERCIMQHDIVDPATCQCVSYCPQATPPKTNADRIRAMTDEELAQVLRNPCDIADHGPTGWCKERNCGYQCALEWLKEEAEEGG